MIYMFSIARLEQNAGEVVDWGPYRAPEVDLPLFGHLGRSATAATVLDLPCIFLGKTCWVAGPYMG